MTDTVQIQHVGPTAQVQRLRISSSTSNHETTMPKPKNQQEPPAEGVNGSTSVSESSQESSATGPIGAAIELRTSLRTTLADVNTLIASLRRQKR